MLLRLAGISRIQLQPPTVAPSAEFLPPLVVSNLVKEGLIMKTPGQIVHDLPQEDRNFYIEMAAAAVLATVFVLAI